MPGTIAHQTWRPSRPPTECGNRSTISILSHVSICLLLTALAMPAQTVRDNPGQPGPGTQKKPATDCAASGTVVNALTGEPIPRAMVSITGGTGDSDTAPGAMDLTLMLDPDDVEPGAATDAMGNWAIANLRCGARTPTATRDGFLSGNENLPGAEAEKRTIQLVSGSPVTDVKIALIPGGIVSGTVRDSYGDALHGAQVLLMRVRTQSGKRGLSQAGVARTDDEGNFRMGGLERGSYVVCAGSEQVTYPTGGGEPLIFPDTCFPGPLETAHLTSFRLEPGREVRTALILTATRGAHIKGRISAASGAQASTAFPPWVGLVKATTNSGLGYMGSGFHRIQPDGTFEIAPLRPGSYMASAGGAQVRIEVGSADIDNVVLTLEPLGDVVGTVRYELSHPASDSGPGRRGKPNLDVDLSPAEGTIRAGMPSFAKWDSDRLNFAFVGVVADRYRIDANLPAGTAYVKSVTLKGQDVRNQAFGVDGPAGPIEIVVSDDTGGVNATVSDGDGKPVAASVVLVPANGQARILVSGNDGHAKDENIPPGEYRAWAFGDIDSVPYAEPDWMARNAGPGEKVTVTVGGTANIALKKTTVLTE